MKQKINIEIICFLLTFLFVYAAFNKLFNYSEFKTQLTLLLFPKPFAMAIAWLIPVIELAISVVLTFKATRLKGLYASFILLSFFSLYIIIMLLSKDQLSCSCGGVINLLTWKQHLILNIFFMILSGWGLILTKQKQQRSVITSIVTQQSQKIGQ